MRPVRRFLGPLRGEARRGLALAALLALAGTGGPCRGASARADALWFAETALEQRVSPDDSPEVEFTFSFTNRAAEPVVIESVRATCGCTVAHLPDLPWIVLPEEAGEFSVTLELRGRRSGSVTKSLFLNTSIGVKPLSVRVVLQTGKHAGEDEEDEERRLNREIARMDRSAVFRDDCAACHALPAEGRYGRDLYLVACAICHEATRRDPRVPDLKRAAPLLDREAWLAWISFGKHGSLMPAFAVSEGGILDAAQIDSLADFLMSPRGSSQRSAADPSRSPTPP